MQDKTHNFTVEKIVLDTEGITLKSNYTRTNLPMAHEFGPEVFEAIQKSLKHDTSPVIMYDSIPDANTVDK